MGKYDNSVFTHPYWQGDTVYGETVWPVAFESGDITVPLLYHADEIISVSDTRLEKYYTEGRDYLLKDGMISIIRSGDIPITEKDEFNYPEIKDKNALNIASTEGGFLLFGEGDHITKRQIAVTYKHGEDKSVFIPETTSRLPRLSEMLKSGKTVRLAYFGDSITVGANSSGFEGIRVPPYAPIWPLLITEYLNNKGIKTEYLNKAVGGVGSLWGSEKLEELFSGAEFDLFVIAFGMNDIGNAGFEENIVSMMDKAKKLCPECEIMLVSTTLPHKLAAGFYGLQYRQQEILEGIVGRYETGVALVPMTDVHSFLLTRKRFFDMTGNNVNHPNDFLASVYAQVLLQVMGAYEL